MKRDRRARHGSRARLRHALEFVFFQVEDPQGSGARRAAKLNVLRALQYK
ncbi:MAG: hypothetical protein ACRDKU_07035 [Gaiellaceae bacterium]